MPVVSRKGKAYVSKTAKRSPQEEKVQGALSEVLKMFENPELLPEAVARTFITRKTSDKPSNSWSLGNLILMVMAGTEDARGFKQWQEVGRRVKKGAKAFYILAPIKATVTKKRIDEETGEEVEEKFQVIRGFRPIPVFRFEDTEPMEGYEGKPYELPDYTPIELPPLFEVAKRFDVEVTWEAKGADHWGYYSPGQQKIGLCTYDVKTWFHELAHAAQDRLGLLKPTAFGSPEYAKDEVVAETAAAVLCLMYGYEGFLPHTREYVKSWGGEDPGKAVLKVISEVEKVLCEILATTESSDEEQAA